MKQHSVIRTVYLYVVTVVGIIMALIGLIGGLTNLLNMYLFKIIATEEMRYLQSGLLQEISALIVGIPVWLYHWNIIQEFRHHSTTTHSDSPIPETPLMESKIVLRKDWIRTIYIYLLSIIGLFIVIFNLISIASSIYSAFYLVPSAIIDPIKDGVIASAGKNTYEIQTLIGHLVAVIVGLPVWLYHWHLGQIEAKE